MDDICKTSVSISNLIVDVNVVQISVYPTIINFEVIVILM